MTAKEVLQKVKSIFNEAPVAAAAPVPVPPATIEEPVVTGVDSILEDGRVMHCEPDMQVGATCTIDGQPTPAGDYTMQDGTVCTVDESGTITNVASPSPMTQEVPAIPTFEERLAKIEEALAKLTAPAMPTGLATEAQLQAATEKIEKQDKVIEGLFELAEKLAETPTAEPKTLNGNKKAQFERTIAKEQKIEGIASAITQLKNKNK